MASSATQSDLIYGMSRDEYTAFIERGRAYKAEYTARRDAAKERYVNRPRLVVSADEKDAKRRHLVAVPKRRPNLDELEQAHARVMARRQARLDAMRQHIAQLEAELEAARAELHEAIVETISTAVTPAEWASEGVDAEVVATMATRAAAAVKTRPAEASRFIVKTSPTGSRDDKNDQPEPVQEAATPESVELAVGDFDGEPLPKEGDVDTASSATVSDDLVAVSEAPTMTVITASTDPFQPFATYEPQHVRAVAEGAPPRWVKGPNQQWFVAARIGQVDTETGEVTVERRDGSTAVKVIDRAVVSAEVAGTWIAGSSGFRVR